MRGAVASGFLKVLVASGGGALALAILATPLAAAPGGRPDIQGAWVQEGFGCKGVFASRSGRPVFGPAVSLFAPAFIVTGKRLVTPQASCRLKSSAQDGAKTILTLQCANSISHEDVKVILEKKPDGRLARYLDAQDQTGSLYASCPVN